MASFNKFQSFVEALAHGKHDFSSDACKVMLTNSAPSATDSVKTDITEITAENGYSAGGAQASLSASGQTAGTYKLVLDDVVFTASGGAFGPFRYAVLYNDDAPSDELIGWWDYGSSITPQDGETFTADLDASNGVLTIV